MSDSRRPPDVDYLTRDYEGFRQLLLSLIQRSKTPWNETAAADLGITVVEILANRFDHLSYAADRIAEEGFLTTARRREYARRHAALGDHVLDDGNASTGYQYFRVSEGTKGPLLLRAGAQVGTLLASGQTEEDRVIAETTEDAILDARLNTLDLARSAPPGATTLHVLAAGGAPVDLQALGLGRGRLLAIRDRVTDDGEILHVRRVQGGVIELRDPISRTYVATDGDGQRGAVVLGNIVPIRRGVTLAVPDAAALAGVTDTAARKAKAKAAADEAAQGVADAATAEDKARADLQAAKKAAAAAAKASQDANKTQAQDDAARAAAARAQDDADKAGTAAAVAADALVAAQNASAFAQSRSDSAAMTLTAATTTAQQALVNALPAGGAALADVLPDTFLQRRLADLHDLRDEAEAARAKWIGDASYAGWWELANAEIARVLYTLRAEPGGTISAANAASLDERLVRAGSLYAALARAVGRDADDPGDRVTLPVQRISLPSDTPVVWSDGEPLLEVYVAPPPPSAGSGQAVAAPVSKGPSTDEVLWQRKVDLLRSSVDDRHYVVEIDEDGDATLRFGDGVNGAMLAPGSTVRVALTTGDPSAGDMGQEALLMVASATVEDAAGKPVEPFRIAFDGTAPTENPFATSGARPPEELGEALGRTIRREMAVRVVPVTTADYETYLQDRQQFPDIAEAKATTVSWPAPATTPAPLARAWPSADRVDVVIRPRSGSGVDPARVLDQARTALRERRLAGTDVWVRLCDPLYVSLSIVVELDPAVDDAEVRPLLRRALLALFEGGDQLLGVPRTRAEVYGTIEGVPGVSWSQVTRFDVAARRGARAEARDEITPQPHEVVRLLDLPDVPGAGQIEVSIARRFRLVLELGFDDPDPAYASVAAFLGAAGAPPGALDPVPALAEYLTGALSGSRSPAAVEGWPAVDAASLDAALAAVLPEGATVRLRTLFILVGERAVDRVALAAGEVPVVDSVQIREQPFRPHFSLERQGGAAGDLEERVRGLLSGVAGSPVKQGWGEITLAQVQAFLLGCAIPSADVDALRALRVGSRRVERLPLGRHDVPVFDGFVAPVDQSQGGTS